MNTFLIIVALVIGFGILYALDRRNKKRMSKLPYKDDFDIRVDHGLEIYGIIRRCPGGFHSWVRSSVGVIRKPNSKIPSHLI